jgi:hypothetical protein
VLAVLGLYLAIRVVGLVLGVLVPAVLFLLSIVFGRPLRDAARATRSAGQDARRSMAQALQYVLHGRGASDEGAPDEAVRDAAVRGERQRAEDEPPPKARVRVDDGTEVVDTTAEGVDSSDERRVQR